MIRINSSDRIAAMLFRLVAMLGMVKSVILDLGMCILGLMMIGLVARSGQRDWRLASSVFLFAPFECIVD
jgi:uncharacterized RDD family membrane protein YckC